MRMGALPALALLSLRVSALPAAEPGARDVLLDTMNRELQRNYEALKQKADPAPYFMAYEVTDLDTHEVGASLGVLNLSENGHNRYLDVTVRVGDRNGPPGLAGSPCPVRPRFA